MWGSWSKAKVKNPKAKRNFFLSEGEKNVVKEGREEGMGGGGVGFMDAVNGAHPSTLPSFLEMSRLRWLRLLSVLVRC